MLCYRYETCYQIALAIKKEVEDLEAAGIQVGLPFLSKYTKQHVFWGFELTKNVIASSLVPTTRDCWVLPEKQHHRLSL